MPRTTEHIADVHAATDEQLDSYNDRIVNYLLSLKHFELRPVNIGQVAINRDESEQILTNTLYKDPALFLEKWGKFLTADLIQSFPTDETDYEITFHLDRLKKSLFIHQPVSNQHSDTAKLVRNRRFKYLKLLLDRNDDYFSIHAMRDREPIIYQEYIGQFITTEQMHAEFPSDMRLVDRIFHDVDNAMFLESIGKRSYGDNSSFLKNTSVSRNSDKDEDIVEYDTDSDDNEDQSEFTAHPRPKSEIESNDNAISGESTDQLQVELDDNNTTKEQIDLLEVEFNRIMHERFVDGLDDFDYSIVDNCEEYDDFDILALDAEDRYFDSEDPSN